jgi:hypothetical protein
MVALDRAGRQADALMVFHDLRARLIDELGVEPGTELQELHAGILARVPASPPPAALPAGAPGLNGDSPPARSDRAIPELRTAIHQQWTAEAELRSLNRPEPVPLTWSNTGRPVAAPASNVFDGVSGRGGRLTFSGDLGDVVAKFRQLPTRQLVVLGAPGAGKSVLAILFTLGLLNDPRPGEPVPVLVSMASWNPYRQHLHQWLASRLLEAHPGLANEDRYGRDAATRLVLDGKVLPVLDGLDETPAALHAPVIDALDHAIALGRPLVVTSRAQEYERAVKETGAVLSRAAVIEIEPVEPGAAIAFLTSRTVGETRWRPLEEHLRRMPDSALARVLRTPLMVDLARTAYTSPDTTPADLCDPRRFGDQRTIEDHLLDTYLPTAYADRPLPPGLDRSARYSAAQAERWLTFLARALHRQGTQDLAWWHLDRAVARSTASLYLSVIPGFLFLLTGWVAAGPVIGLIYGGCYTTAGFVAHRFGRHAQPLRVEVRFQQSVHRFLLRFAIGAVIGTAFGLGWTLPARLVVVLAVVFGAAIGLHVWLDAPLNAERASTPATVLHNDRTATSVYTLSFMVSLGLFYGVALAFTPGQAAAEFLSGHFDPVPAVVAGLSTALLGYFLLRTAGAAAYGTAGFFIGGQVFPTQVGDAVLAGVVFSLAAGTTVFVARAWGTYTITRLWLALRRQLPLHLMQFLEDAHRRGVLRQAGAVYQFRHARLQERLATRNGAAETHP